MISACNSFNINRAGISTGYPILSPEVNEGICQVLAHMWLDSEINAASGSDATSSSSSSSSSSSPPSSSSKKGGRSDFEKKLGGFLKHNIESNPSTAYGEGFRQGNQAVNKYGLKRTLDHIRMTGSYPL
ncbi:DA1-RELATED PROTEIN 1 [Hibiscus trionum]|uniref:DA1-RELATED PROTEIN 1 n=1 Tax=Hibiscus trionum TaxID=183268 RepID=A0A9W7H3S2_HIBTR|nr:DA1-RELATED PROTEIN 1 [Hibiscus trionum]